MNDLVLRSRLDTLRRTLAEVRTLRESLLEARRDLHDLEKILAPTLVDSIRTDAGEVLDKLGTSIRRLDDMELAETGILDDLVDAEGRTRKVRKQARTAHEIIKRLQQRWVEIDDGRIGPTLDSYMVNVARRCAQDVDKVEKALGAAQTEDAVRGVWLQFQDVLHGDSEPLFDEYVDLLGGLALRTVGFGDAVCQKADVLLKLLLQRSSGPKWDSLAVPAHTEALRMTPAQIIRLGFPGWTVWELPLAAHDFGHAVAASLPAVQDAIEDAAWRAHGPRVLTTLFADGFAAYSLGPAYACAAVLLRLNPLGATESRDGEPSDATRAKMTLSTLRAIDKDGAFKLVIEELEKQWAAAVQQVQKDPTSDANEELVENWCEKVVWLLRGETPNAEYTAKHWKAISHWVEEMRGGSSPTPTSDADVRDVLNVAWQSRLQDLSATKAITKTALQFWDAVTKTPSESDGREQPGAARTGPKG